MIDISDGFAADVGHICDASRVGVVLDEVPVAEGVAEVAKWRGEDASLFALGGGDAYELAAAIADPGAFTQVGSFIEGSGVRLASGAQPPAGWDHFA